MSSKPFHKILLIFISGAMALSAEASVYISEIAWMGTEASANDEWIELGNNGTNPADLTGWVLRILDKKDIPLSGSIAPSGFYLIERTDDDTVPNIPADLIFPFGALSNSGETLILLNASGAEVERVESGGNWAIGGSNPSKETVQRKDSAWITASPTPKAPVMGGFSGNETVENSSAAPVNRDTSQTSSVYREVERFSAKITGPDRVIVGADAMFKGTAYGVKGDPVPNARMLWNFGDGTTGEGKSVLHSYRHPGKYTLVLEISSGEHAGTERVVVIAVSPDLAISNISDESGGFVEISNMSQFEIDLSGWHLRSGQEIFSLPKNTYIAASGKLVLSNEVTKLKPLLSDTSLLFPNGTKAVSFQGVAAQKETQEASTPLPEEAPEKVEAFTKSVSFKEVEEERREPQPLAAVSSAKGGGGKWMVGASALITISLIVLALASKGGKTKEEGGELSAEDFSIAEDKS